MQELEKILEEIDKEIAKERVICEDLEDTPGWRLYEKTMNRAKDIIRKHMNDGWIPVEERLPEVPDDMEDEYCPEFNVTIKGASRATTLKYSPDGAWFDDSGQVYVVIAWRPLPDLYKKIQEENK